MISKITHKEYCSTICEAKCCYVRYEDIAIMPCPKLNKDNLCSIYKERYEDGRPYTVTKAMKWKDKLLVINMDCGKIENLLKENKLPDVIKKQCCYYDSNLLRVHHEHQELPKKAV